MGDTGGMRTCMTSARVLWLIGLFACSDLKSSKSEDLDAGTDDDGAVVVIDEDSGVSENDSGVKRPDAGATKWPVSVLATAQTKIYGLAFDGSEVFFTTEDGMASVRAVQPSPLAVRTVAPFNINDGFNVGVGELALVQNQAYWTNLSGGLFRIGKSGPPRVRAVPSESYRPLARSGAELFYVDRSNYYLFSYVAGAATATRRGKDYIISPRSIEVDATTIYWAEAGPLAAKAGGIKSIARTATDATPATVLYSDGPDWFAGGIALTANDVFFAEPGKARVAKVAKSGGPALVVAESLVRPISVRIDGDNLFILDAGRAMNDGAVYVMSHTRSDARPALVASGLGQPQNFIVDTKHIYVACTGAGELVSVKRP
jgi:hypothetical protein